MHTPPSASVAAHVFLGILDLILVGEALRLLLPWLITSYRKDRINLAYNALFVASFTLFAGDSIFHWGREPASRLYRAANGDVWAMFCTLGLVFGGLTGLYWLYYILYVAKIKHHAKWVRGLCLFAFCFLCALLGGFVYFCLVSFTSRNVWTFVVPDPDPFIQTSIGWSQGWMRLIFLITMVIFWYLGIRRDDEHQARMKGE